MLDTFYILYLIIFATCTSLIADNLFQLTCYIMIMLFYIHYIHCIGCILVLNLNSSFSKMINIALVVNACQASTSTCVLCFLSNFQWVLSITCPVSVVCHCRFRSCHCCFISTFI